MKLKRLAAFDLEAPTEDLPVLVERCYEVWESEQQSHKALFV